MNRQRVYRRKYGVGGSIGGSIGALAGTLIPIPGVGTAIGGTLGAAAGNYIEDKLSPKDNTQATVTNNTMTAPENYSMAMNPYGNSFAGGGNLKTTNMRRRYQGGGVLRQQAAQGVQREVPMSDAASTATGGAMSGTAGGAKTLYDFYRSKNQPMPSISERQKQMSAMGIKGQAGTPEGNQALLTALSTPQNNNVQERPQAEYTEPQSVPGINYEGKERGGVTNMQADPGKAPNAPIGNEYSMPDYEQRKREAMPSYKNRDEGSLETIDTPDRGKLATKDVEVNTPSNKITYKKVLDGNGREVSAMHNEATGELSIRGKNGKYKPVKNNSRLWRGTTGDASAGYGDAELSIEDFNARVNARSSYETVPGKDPKYHRIYRNEDGSQVEMIKKGKKWVIAGEDKKVGYTPKGGYVGKDTNEPWRTYPERMADKRRSKTAQ